MDGGFGALLLIALAVVAGTVASLVLIVLLVVVVAFGVVGVLVINERREFAKRIASEVELEDL